MFLPEDKFHLMKCIKCDDMLDKCLCPQYKKMPAVYLENLPSVKMISVYVYVFNLH